MTTQTLNLSHPNIIALTINGSLFLMTASKELSPSMKDEMKKNLLFLKYLIAIQ